MKKTVQPVLKAAVRRVKTKEKKSLARNRKPSLLEQMDTQTQETVLSNGVVVVTCRMPVAESVSMGVWARVGGRLEPVRLGGIYHLLEHMVFKGTRRRSARQIAEAVEGVGGYLNATTTHDHTVYYGSVAADYWRRLLSVLTDLVVAPRFEQRDLEREKRVIGEEILMVEDEPAELVQDRLWEEIWPGSGLGRPLTGTLKTLRGISREELVRVHRRAYCGANLIVSAAGKVEHEAVVREAERLLGGVPRGRRMAFAPAPVHARRPRIAWLERETQQLHVGFALPGCCVTSSERPIFTLLNTLLAGNMTSRLFQELRERRGLCYHISSSLSSYHDTGVVDFYTGVDVGQLQRVFRILARTFARLGEKSISAGELRRAKQYVLGSGRLSLERSGSQNARLGYARLFWDRIPSLQGLEARLQAVTAEEIQALSRWVLDLNRMVVTLVGAKPEGAEEALLGLLGKADPI